MLHLISHPMSDQSPRDRLVELSIEITQLESDSRRLKSERRIIARQEASLARSVRYLRFLRWFRSPAKSTTVWPMLMLTIGPFLVAVLTMIVVDMILGSRLYALVGFLLGATIAAGLFAILLYRPSDAVLEVAVPEAQSQAELVRSLLVDVINRCIVTDVQLKKLLDKRREQLASDEMKRVKLLDRDWKQMRGYEWENYLVEVCRTLGAKVVRTGKSGDQGVDLIVESGELRIAVQAKGYSGTVGNKAVQEAFTGARHYGCNACAVVTNSCFTKQAEDLAICTGCTLIGEREFPAFVMGKIVH